MSDHTDYDDLCVRLGVPNVRSMADYDFDTPEPRIESAGSRTAGVALLMGACLVFVGLAMYGLWSLLEGIFG